ncbi:hypothetical protein RDI58_030170 [Solanum bulbocastanum]|uniref:Uncharacterized protein n=1 Tax=Solanum bulbocastanum TaxID=147425 RepID=A0AAN8SRT0_SOLBU
MFHRHRVSKVTIIGAINGVFPSVTGEIPYSKEIFLVHTLLPNPERSYVNVPRVGTSTFLSQSMGLGFGSGL